MLLSWTPSSVGNAPHHEGFAVVVVCAGSAYLTVYGSVEEAW